MLFLLLILFFTSRLYSLKSSVFLYELPKCCDFESAFTKVNDSFLCNKSVDSRVSFPTNEVIRFNETNEECVESIDLQLYLFNITSNKTTIVENITNQMVSKCCPRNFLYVPSTHSCIESLHNYTDQFNATVINIGLPTCEIIYDYNFDFEHEFQINDDNIYILKTDEKIKNGEYCLDKTTESKYVIRVCKNYTICNSVRCIHKCCPDGQSFVNGSHCRDTFVYGMNLENLSKFIADVNEEYAIIHGYKTGVYIPNTSNFYLDSLGNFYSYSEKNGNEVYYPEDETYCIEHATKGGRIYGHTFFRVIQRTDYIMDKKFLFNRWAMIVSSIFLKLTILYYICSKQIAKVFGKTLVSFCIALLILYVMLVYCTFTPNLNTTSITMCKAIGFLLIYMSFSCFVWLQIMCYDIYWTFGSGKRFSTLHEKRRSDFKRFAFYSLYGWGLPLIMTLIPLIFHFADTLPTLIKVTVGETKCLIERGEDNYAEILFYISPLTAIQITNVVFFVKTVRYCLQVKGDIQKMIQSPDAHKKKNKFLAQRERFGLVVKLSVTMGLFFLFEVVSSFYDFKKNNVTEYIEIIWDLINCLQGLFIFILFVCKKKNFKDCRNNATINKLRKISLSSNSTRMTAISSMRKLSQESRRKCSREEARNKLT